MSLREAVTLLGISAAADARTAHRAFRRLARSCHPDVARESGAAERFARLVDAYRTVQRFQRADAEDLPFADCPRCRRERTLLRGLDGRTACAECLLGRPRRGYFLPLPILVTVRHAAAWAAYLVAAGLLVISVSAGRADLLTWAGGLVLVGSLALAWDVRRYGWRAARSGRE